MTEIGYYQLLKQLPQIDQILRLLEGDDRTAGATRSLVVKEARTAVDEARKAILAGKQPDTGAAEIAARAASRIERGMRPSLRRVINASGVIIHTNLGRSSMAKAAKAAVDDVMDGYCTLEYDIDAMARGSRHSHCECLICQITGAEAAIAVNNNAAAVMVVLSEFARGHEAVVSRGELIEIGGSFRIPDIMDQSGANMVEVGTTNKTHPHDYERAIAPETGMFLKVHPSNYRVIGFTKTVSVADLRRIADKENAHRLPEDAILVYEDQGSGSFVNLDVYGEYAEPTVAESIALGADLVSFSGDKLLGGPQAGIIVGSKKLIDRLKKNPLARVLRLDKMTLAALEATLRLHLDPKVAMREIPTVRMLAEDPEDTRARAEKLRDAISQRIDAACADLAVVPEISRAGGGALAQCDIPSYAVEVAFNAGNAQDCEEYMIKQLPVPIVGRIRQERVLFDARTIIDDGEITSIAEGLAAYFGQLD
ncbi:MAG: L-seryl-tRNA(Sec) selenium transferase [Coriobacteriaceae bacterium]|nr:L-seryl-tRNA(Sec) selenium transferase [Coriobacteriaceae bacterium]